MSYFNAMLNKACRQKIFDRFAELIALKGKPDLLVGTGVSGCLGMTALSHEFDIPIAIIRKEEDNAHSGDFNFSTTAIDINKIRKAMAVDDLISSGATIRRIVKIPKECGYNFDINSIFLYNHEYTLFSSIQRCGAINRIADLYLTTYFVLTKEPHNLYEQTSGQRSLLNAKGIQETTGQTQLCLQDIPAQRLGTIWD